VASDAELGRGGALGSEIPALCVPEIRDFQRINAELAQLLNKGARRVRLLAAEGQRLLVSGLSGSWDAVVEVEGRAGPELAAGLNAPGLTVVCHGSASDGAGSGLRAGMLLILGDAGPAVAYAQQGGIIAVSGSAGPRAGLKMAGGVLVLLGEVGMLAGERQSGGSVFTVADRVGPHAGFGRRGGRFAQLASPADLSIGASLDPIDATVLRAIAPRIVPWLRSRFDRVE
jgi:glutamate synthase domain-containing protein 3